VATKKNLENRELLRAFMEEFGLSQPEVAEVLSAETRRDVSLDSIKSWLCDPTANKARTCPDWPIKILGEAYK